MLIVREEKEVKQFINLSTIIRVTCANKEIFFHLDNSRNSIQWSFTSNKIAKQNYQMIIDDYDSGLQTCYINEKEQKETFIDHGEEDNE